jgi:SAM-dependent methyltransferase
MLKFLYNRFKAFYFRQQFNPGFFGLFLNPFYFARKELFRVTRSFAPHLSGDILDIGCGSKPYQTLFTNAVSYVGLEYDTPDSRLKKSADFFYDGAHFPFPDAAFDSAVCNQVLEHVFMPEAFVAEICRILKPGGTLLLSVPFVWDEHEQPWDFARYTTYGLKALLERHGFLVTHQVKTNDDARIIFQLINAYLFRICITRYRSINMLIFVFLMGPFNVLGLIFGKILPSNPDLFLDQFVLAKKK